MRFEGTSQSAFIFAINLLYLYTQTYCKQMHLISMRTNAILSPDHCSAKETGLIPIYAFNFYPNQVRLLPCLVAHSVTALLWLNFDQIVGFVKVVRWISPSCFMDLSKLIHGFVKTDIWIFLSWYRDLWKVMHDFLWVVIWIY